MKNIMLMSDGYKLSHHRMYPKGTELVFSNFTPRSSKHAPQGAPKNGVIVMGIKKCIEDLHKNFEEFFKNDFDESVNELLDSYLMTRYDMSHFRELHEVGYLPVEIRALDEGSFCPIGVPFFTIHNTDKRFFWLTNFLETYISATLWRTFSASTIASSYYKVVQENFNKTCKGVSSAFNVHNFSARGMDSLDAMVQADLGHLLFFNGSDTLPTMQALKDLYDVVNYMGNVPATEHSVMCAGGKDTELETYRNLMNEFPNGFLSLVSDTWDLWNVITNILPQLKEQIMSRDGRLVIRPDSGNPVDIICGEPKEFWTRDIKDIPKQKGAIELLWDIFGGTINEQGYKVLDSHIGLIYGDSITIERAIQIYKRLEAKGFASCNIVLGVGSYSYGFQLGRDSYGSAIKATYVEINGEGQNIFKDPVTDDGTKKSATGLLVVKEESGAHGTSNPYLVQEATWKQVYSEDNLLKIVYKDGVKKFKDSWEQITQRAKLNSEKLTF